MVRRTGLRPGIPCLCLLCHCLWVQWLCCLSGSGDQASAAAAILKAGQEQQRLRRCQQQELMARSRQISSDWLWDWSVSTAAGAAGDGHYGSRGLSGEGWDLGSQQALMQHSYSSTAVVTTTTGGKKLSMRQWVMRHGLFSKEILSMFLLSNLVSSLIGGGIVYSFLIRRPVDHLISF